MTLFQDTKSTVTTLLFVTVLMLFGAGCARTDQTTPSQQTPEHIQELTTEHTAWIKQNIHAGTIPQKMGRPAHWQLPEGIVPAQFQNAYVLVEGTAFGLIQQPNINTPLITEDGTVYRGSISFAGILFTQDDGQTWQRLFSIPTSTAKDGEGNVIRMNPVGISWQEESYVFDIADDRGAGSGEGNLTRFWTGDGRTWSQDERCYILIPERYDDEPGTQASVTSLEDIPCPHYMQNW